MLVFDRQGNLLRHWGGPGQGYEWPEVEHGIYVDANDFVWLAGSGAKDHQLLKFTLDGSFVMQIGRSGQSKGNADTANLNRPADVEVDTEARRFMSPTATATAASSCSIARPAPISGTGVPMVSHRWMAGPRPMAARLPIRRASRPRGNSPAPCIACG
ncbi:hypothetical protein ACFQU7_39135 [Pseudoroseomonas wenyumeiae]